MQTFAGLEYAFAIGRNPLCGYVKEVTQTSTDML